MCEVATVANVGKRWQLRTYTHLFFGAHQKATLATPVFKRWFISTLHAPFTYISNGGNFAHILTFFSVRTKRLHWQRLFSNVGSYRHCTHHLPTLATVATSHIYSPFFRCAPKGYIGNACFQTLVHIDTARTIYLH